MTAPFLPQRQQLAMAVEGTEGSAETLDASDVIAPVFGLNWTPNFETIVREVVQPSLSGLSQVVGERSATVEFSTELKGSGSAGTVPPNLSVPLQCSGWSETIVGGTSVTYALASEDVPTATIEVREAGQSSTCKIRQVVGARGSWAIEAVKGNHVLVSFTFTGRYVEPTEGSFLTVPSPAPKPEPFLNASISFQGISTIKASTVSVDGQNDVQLRNDANEVTGNFSAVIVNRDPVASIDPELELIATANFFKKYTDGDEGDLDFVLGATAGNITSVSLRTQITNVTPGERDSMRIESLDLALIQNAAAGDDEATIAFT